MSDWFVAFREEAQKHDTTKYRLAHALALLRAAYEQPTASESTEWRERAAKILEGRT